MLKNELYYFFAALGFYTRIPCPSWTKFSNEILNKSLKYFPAIGWLIGFIAAVSILLLQFIFPLSISILLSMILTVYITGAFHEDGFTDSCDGFGGGWTKEQVLTIMKDSRIGAYGTVGIILLLGLKFLALYEIGLISLPILIISYFNAHIASRFMAVLVIQNHDYVQDIDKSKSKPIAARKLSFGEMLYSGFFMLSASLLFYPHYLLFLAFPVIYFTQLYLGQFFKRRIGGYTGDALGATQQITEVIFYLTILALCRIIFV
ncbi:adenosylcobinamide-GDP ribazoletransferase [Candidatus Albibeggiatoa sp. nov. NOAA]|uniref:adenosylcobinamide-GDP ribazoletransferase n=1 Tax=Candidatus Albibeggiatoa sp. nov. NOAA TaxID=3162724 RepID=UPI0032F951EB|nr:adenosylcobinamide-GDP ribazoletransferase [Thiotrichaceae bacterium]